MPWSVKKDDRCPADEPWGVVKDDDNALEGCHPSEAAAQKQQAALYAAEGRSMDTEIEEVAVIARPPRDNLVRSLMPGVEWREAGEDAVGPVLFGHFAVFNQWAEIDSAWEGHFMERIAPGAFAKSFQEKRDKIQLLFQHGKDPDIGDKVIGAIQELREDKIGAYFEANLFDGLPPLVVSGLKANKYGASFRFNVMKEDFKRYVQKSPYNPDGLPERTVHELDMPEFGPVTFPAYHGASVGIRSDTDDYIRRLLVPEFDEIRETLKALRQQALPGAGAGSTHSDEGSSVIAATPKRIPVTREEFPEWLQSLSIRS